MQLKRVLLLLITVYVLSGNSFALTKNPESDLKCSPWAYDTLQILFDENLISKDWQLIDFTQPITRLEFVDFFIPIVEDSKGLQLSYEDGRIFDDLPAGAQINVHKAYGLGIITGVSPTQFEPYSSLTREQIAVISVKALNAIDELTLSYRNHTFNDTSEISQWAKGYVVLAVNNRLMDGIGANLFAPQDVLTKEEALILGYRFLKNHQDELYEEIAKNEKAFLGKHLEQVLVLSEDINKMIFGDLLRLRNYTVDDVENVYGPIHHEGFDFETDNRLLLYPQRQFLLVVKDEAIKGFSINCTEDNDFFKGTIGTFKTTYSIEEMDAFEGTFSKDTESGLIIFTFNVGKDQVEFIWDTNEIFKGIAYFFG